MQSLTRAFVWIWTALYDPVCVHGDDSLKSPGQALAIPPVWIFEPTFSNYADVLLVTGLFAARAKQHDRCD